MLRPIPQSLLGDLAIIKVCTGMDAVVPGAASLVAETKENTEVVLRSTLFIDARLSRPALDYDSLAEHSQKAGKPLRCEVFNSQGQKYGEYEVLTVDPVPDVPATRVHHVELGLV